jgi:ferrous iron transport protein B
MKKIVLIGNPNAGKSLMFSRITGAGAISANWAGTTVECKVGRFTYGGAEYELVDAPGLYSLDPGTKAEAAAVKLVDNGDILVNIVDATCLERNLTLTLQLLARQRPTVVCLNFWDDTTHRGITIDAAELETLLGVPVVPASALTGAGVKDLVASFDRARASAREPEPGSEWRIIGDIVNRVQTLTHRHHTPLEMVADFTVHPVGGLLSAAVVLVATFALVRLVGEGITTWLLEPLYTRWYAPWVIAAVSHLHLSTLTGMLLGTTADPLQSFGILTTGIYVGLVQVFPYYFSFYFFFGLLEDFGYLPRLAVVLDSFFHRMGLHGYSSIPVLLGLGCKVPALLSTRMLTKKREKILTVALVLMAAPCLPQSAMIISLGMRYGVGVVGAIFSLLLLLSLFVNAVLNKTLPGEASELFIEIPPYRLPSIRLLVKKMRIRVVSYAVEVFPMIAVGVVIIHLLDTFKVLESFTDATGKPIAGLLGLPHDIGAVMLLGFLRKDVSIALLAPFNLSAHQFVIASIFMALYIPCIASFFTLVKELGIKSSLAVMAVIFVAATATTAGLNGIFSIFR